MLNIDISVPIVGKSYDFSVDENTKTEIITEDIIDLIIQKEGFSDQSVSSCNLFFAERKMILDPNRTLSECGVGNGDRLLLV